MMRRLWPIAFVLASWAGMFGIAFAVVEWRTEEPLSENLTRTIARQEAVDVAKYQFPASPEETPCSIATKAYIEALSTPGISVGQLNLLISLRGQVCQ